MYSGSTLPALRYVDTWFGAHQKIDRVARKRLQELVPGDTRFPVTKDILHFEGVNGPDAIKRKTPAQDEPWHYYDPTDPTDDKILIIIKNHYKQLVQALRSNNQPRAAFEAAWLAHAVVDGLTPAHHYPYEQELVRLRGGAGVETRNTPKEKIVMPGDTFRKKLHNNWQMWGDKGLLATHIAFEVGIAGIIAPLKMKKAVPTLKELKALKGPDDVEVYFKQQALKIKDMSLYEQFYAHAWTPNLSRQVSQKLVPTIVRTVTAIWYSAEMEARTNA
ncbi:MAG: hypothetical protein WAS36_04480 [Candidatus Saccharimonadales bacterium]